MKWEEGEVEIKMTTFVPQPKFMQKGTILKEVSVELGQNLGRTWYGFGVGEKEHIPE